MKARKKRRAVVSAILLAVTVLCVNAVPVMAEEHVTTWTKYEPNNSLVIPMEKIGTTVIAGKTTANKPVVIWTENELSDEEKAAVWESFKGNPGVGNPKNVVYVSGSGAAAYGMSVDSESGAVSFDRTKNWSLLYWGDLKAKEPEAEPETETETEPESEPETEKETEPESEQETEPESQPETETETEPESEPESQPESETETEAESEQESGTEPETERTTEPETEPVLDGDTERETETLPEETVTGNEPEEDIPPETEPESEPETETETEPESEPETEPESEPEFEPVLDGDTEHETETLPEETVTGNEPEEDIPPETEPESEPETKPESELETPADHVASTVIVPTYHSTVTLGSSGAGNSEAASNGPATAHILDDQPKTGLLDSAKGRVLDDTPKTGMPAEFTILLVISVLAMVSLVITLIVEKKTAYKRK